MQKKKGISLIVLVITIIVMIILAASVVITLSNTGIINRANRAVELTNESQVQDLAALIWADAYMDELRGTDLVNKVKEDLDKKGIKEAEWKITVTDSGVSVINKANIPVPKWELKRTTNDSGIVTKVIVTDGTSEIEVGSTINYMVDGVGDTNYKGGWKLLGADENGRLLIVSTADLGITGSNITIGDNANFDTCKTSMEGALTTLQNTVNSYKDGTIGVEVRSIRMDDVDKVTGFDPKTYTTYFMNAGNVNSYGQEVKYEWDNNAVKYTWKNGDETVTGTLEGPHGGYTYFDETTNKIITSAKAASGDIVTLKESYYGYTGKNVLSEETLSYKMLFRNSTDTANVAYWLATRSVLMYYDFTNFCLGIVSSNFANPGALSIVDSMGMYSAYSFPVRAVVTLAADVTLTESKTVSGAYDLNK